MRDLAGLAAADFEPLVGSDFAVPVPGTDGGFFPLRLIGVEKLQGPPGHRQAFSLQFEGPGAPLFGHSVQRLVHPGLGELEVFLGPVGVTPTGVAYEAVFS